MTAIPFNINHSVKIKLTDKAYDWWCTELNRHLSPDMQFTVAFLVRKADADGCVTFQLWEVMQIFGSSIVFGSKPLFDTNIILLAP